MKRTVIFFLLGMLPGLSIQAQNSTAPVQTVLTIEPATATPGREVELRLTMTVSQPWFVYADKAGSFGQQKMKITGTLPDGVKAVEDWQWPRPVAHLYMAGEHIFKRRVKVTNAGDVVEFKISVTYQTCTSESCMPPQTVVHTVQLKMAEHQTTIN